MSGDSPNAFTNEHVFDFKEGGRISPGPTTSKERKELAAGGGPITASVLVEPNKQDATVKDDEPDFSTPILNPDHKELSDGDRIPEESSGDKTVIMGLNTGRKEKDEDNVANGGPENKLPRTTPPKEEDGYSSDEDSCIVNCIYYTMECCKCSIM